MLEYISAPEAAGAARLSRMWLIPKDAEKHVDGQLKISKSTDM